jgi:NAD(P)-dependent dehydrogenase (short-subunit alcohol dehydrogenase family)
MTGQLNGKVALVTGGSAGMGRASALLFAREGAKVVVADVAVDGGEETMQMIKDAGGQAIFVKADTSKATEVEALIRKALETYGRLDCAHNNAGIEGIVTATADYPEEVWDRVIAINLKGIWLCMKYEIPQMLQQGKGAIVNTSSVFGTNGAAYYSAYSASKHGVAGLTKTSALEYAQSGIRINAVCPGVIHTPMIDRTIGGNPEIEAQLVATEPIGRMGEPEEVAEAVVWLCSDAASFVTGHLMAVDGAFSAR